MALESSKDHRKDGRLLQKGMSEFLRQPTSVSSDGSCARTDSGVYFGQKATLSTSGRKVPVVVDSFGKTNRHWNVPVSMPAFSDLTPVGSDPSPLRMLTTSAIPSKSCDYEVETDLARVHPNSNSNTNGHTYQKLFTLPNGDTRSGISNRSPKLPSVQDQGLVNLGLLHSGKDMFSMDSMDTFGRSRPTVLSSPSGVDGQLGRYSPYLSTSPPTYISPLRFNTSDRVTTSTHLTPSPTSPHSSRTFFISYFDLVDTEVKFADQNHSFHGVVKKVSHDKIATVLNYSGSEVKVPCSELKLVPPVSRDKVKVVCSSTGTSKILGKIGTLLSLTGDSGVVDFLPFNGAVSRNLAEVKLSYLAKYITKSDNLVHATLPATTCTNSIWGSVVLNGGSYPFAPYHTLPSTSFPGVLPIVGSSSLSLYNPLALSNAMSTPSGSSITSSSFKPFTPSTNGSTRKHNSNLGLPFSFQVPPLNSPGTFRTSSLQPISRGGTCSSDGGGKVRRHSSNGRQDVAETIDRLLSSQRRYHTKKEDDSNMDVKASCIRVSLVCPISQKRLKYPSRGSHCKHLQCFDAEAYILMNIHHKLKARVKQTNGRSIVQPLPNKKWHCPICLKHVPESQLYIDKSLMSVVTDMGDSMMKVELSEDGSWQPYKKVVVDVIDLTADD